MDLILRSLAALAFVLVLAELFLRRWYKLTNATFVWPPRGRIRLEIDRENLPNLDPVARIEFNRDGERGDDPPLSWEHNGRALIVGGSAAECYMLDQERTWPAVLQRELNSPKALEHLGVGHFHVGSVARSLVPCEALYSILRAVRFRYDRLDLIVLMVGASDVVRWLQMGVPQVMDFAAAPQEETFSLHAEGPFGWQPRQLALRRALSTANERWRRPVLVKRGAGKTLTRLRAMRAQAERIITEVPDPEPLIADFAQHFSALLELAMETAERVLVVRQPWFEGPPEGHTPEQRAIFWNLGCGNPYLETITEYYDHALVSGLLHRVDDTQARISAEHGVQCVNLQDKLPSNLTTWYDYFHLAPQGAEEVGRHVAAAVLGQTP